MESPPCLAHIADDGRQQTVLAHLEGTAARCAAFAGAFDAEAQGRLAGLAHDVGKYADAFQKRLHGGPKVDHSTAGAWECFRRGQPFAAFAVAGHHAGLPDGGARTDSAEHGKSTFWSRMNKAAKGALPPYTAWQQALSLPAASFPAYTQDSQSAGMFFTRMLFSCLVDADYRDTEAFMTGNPDPPAGTDQTLSALWERLQTFVKGWFPPKGDLNACRCAILNRCMEEGSHCAPGLFTLTVPTGGGKTVSSLAFALAHAKAHGYRRVIYVIPYTSIIEQTAQTFREILGEEAVLEHHSGVSYDIDEADQPQSIRFAQATETWDPPVIVTTAVQFFESLFAARPSTCRKLHNIAQSVVVFDEAQMLPLPCLRPCVWTIAQLVQHYHVSAVLCTATQPALEPIFRQFAPAYRSTELCPSKLGRDDVFRRVTFQKELKPASYDAIAQRLQAHAQVLCIVNTRKSAKELYTRLSGEGIYHLSTLLYPAHRRAILKEIRRRLSMGLPCRVVSTSLIEAGVDVDFPTVFREVAGLDSMLQSAGRCNREGKRPAEESVVTIFQLETAPPPLFQTEIAVGKRILQQYDDPSSPQAIRAYFEELRDLMGEAAQDKDNVLKMMEDTENEPFPFRKISEKFHLIADNTKTIYIPLGEGEALVQRLHAGERSRGLFRKLGLYGVSVYGNHYEALLRAGDVEPLDDGSTALLRNLELYSSETGLSLEADPGKAWFI